MSDFNEDFKSWASPDATTSSAPGVPPPNPTKWSKLSADIWAKFLALYIAKIACALAWAASFQTINPIASGVFIADLVPFPIPPELQNFSVSILVNFALGVLAIVLPSIIWRYALDGVLQNPREYFQGNPLRITICALLLIGYGLTISLEILSLVKRVDNTIDTGPIPVLGDQAEMWPLAIASAALILGSCLLGLASAALSRSIATLSSNHD